MIMPDPYEATEALLEDRPDLQDALDELAELDETGPLTFDDAPVDSGAFGEIVSHGIVEEGDEGYRLADREATVAALRGEPKPIPEPETGFERPDLRARLESVNRDLVAGLVAAFAFLFVFRATTWRSVFRDGNVVLPSNDPYHYRYWVDHILANSEGPFDFAYVLEMPERAATQEPLTYVLGWWFTALLESTETTGVVLALFPVACALVVGGFVYLIAVWTTEDERIGLVSVLLFALMPAHALYSGIGFFDHHAIDYVWLSAAGAGLVWLARDLELRACGQRGTNRRSGDPVRDHVRSPLTWLVVGLLGVVFAGMVLTWNGAPLLLLGVALYATLRGTSDVRAGHAPVLTATPLAGALALGTALALVPHLFAGWQEPTVVYSPLFVAIGVVGVSALAEIVHRADLHPGVHLGAVVALAPVGFVGFRAVRPGDFGRFADRFGDLVGRGGIAETQSLFRGNIGIFLDPIDQFGWAIFLALAVLAWASYRCVSVHEPRWLVVCSYAWSFLVLTLIQIRFAGEFSPFAAVLAGTGLVVLLSTLDLARESPVIGRRFGRPDERVRFVLPRRRADASGTGYVAFVILLVASMGLFLVPATMENATIGDDEYEAATWMAEDDDSGEAFVLSRWGRNRMYNYFVSGESDAYLYAEQQYDPLVVGDPDARFDEIVEEVDYLAVHERDETLPENAGYTRLFDAHGSAQGDVDGLSHYRLVFVSSGGEIKVFEVVPGTTIEGNATTDEPFSVETEVSVAGEEFTYERHVEPEDDGSFSVTVAHPGTYEVDGTEVTVTEAEIQNGSTVSAD